MTDIPASTPVSGGQSTGKRIELTLRALVLGCLLAVIFTAANTYLGLKVSDTARVQTPQGPLSNVWAAGEIMAGSILGEGYLAGFGMTIGTVFGRIAGREAAAHVA